MSTPDPEEQKAEGLKLFRRGEYAQALATFEAAAAAFSMHEDDFGRAEILNNIGVIHRLQRRPEAAATALEEAERIFMRLGEHNQQGQVMGNLGDLYATNRNRDKAAGCYVDAAALFTKAGDMEKKSQVLRALSLMRLRQFHLLEAMMRMEESLRVRPRVNLGQRIFRALLRFALRLIAGG
jgi:tetratricopeptide (TPR) repeat protein